MSKLQLKARPWVPFDVANKQHRKWLAEFILSGRWGIVLSALRSKTNPEISLQSSDYYLSITRAKSFLL